jgi:hypothetical protein
MTSPGLEGRGEVVKPLNLIVVTDGGMSPFSLSSLAPSPYPIFLTLSLAGEPSFLWPNFRCGHS